MDSLLAVSGTRTQGFVSDLCCGKVVAGAVLRASEGQVRTFEEREWPNMRQGEVQLCLSEVCYGKVCQQF